MIVLTKPQIKKANKLLEILCESDRISIDKENPLFDSEDEAEFICKFLKSRDLLNMTSDDKRIYDVSKNYNTYNTVKNDVLLKEYEKRDELEALNKRVSELTITNLRLSIKLKRFELIQKWWWLAGVLIFILGFVLANLEVLKLLKQLWQNISH